jgi:hypothetical protein
MQTKKFREETLEYVFLLQQVQERKKFDFVETVNNNRSLSISLIWLIHLAFGFNA